MKPFVKWLIESFDSKPVKFELNDEDDEYVSYQFEVDNNRYNASFVRDAAPAKLGLPEDTWTIEYSLTDDGGYGSDWGVTGTGNMGPVVATVIAAIHEFIKKIDPPVMLIEADKRTQYDKYSGKNPNARANIYFRLLKKNIPSNYSYTVTNEEGKDYMIIKKRDVKIEPKRGKYEMSPEFDKYKDDE